MGIENKKKDIAAQITEVARKFQNFVSIDFVEFNKYVNQKVIDENVMNEKVEENVLGLLNIEKPKVMVYGIYNSGKSTLINSLCGKKVAEMADRPMTSKIAEYDRGDYYLIDSPGIDAPIEHEKVTEENINKCNIILFVISSKGLFEDRTNYIKLVNLIKRDIPFIIVLNDRGTQIKKGWSDDQKKKARFDHDQELKMIQYKIIDNLVRESKDKNIVDKYEVVVLNAKKAWMGIEKDKHQLYEASGVDFLNTRINQLLTSDVKIGAVFKQPISNMKKCLNEVEKIITQTMSGNNSEDFSTRLHTLERKKDNIMDDLRILIQQAVNNHLDELTNSYVNGDSDIYETIANTIYMDIDDIYMAKLNELLVFVDHNFKDLNLYVDSLSNLSFSLNGKTGSSLSFDDKQAKENPYLDEEMPKEKEGFFSFLKSRKKREKEKQERLEREAEIRNQRAQYEMQENIRRKQEARQLASTDLDVLNREFNAIVTQGLAEKYDDLITQIQQIDCLNKQVREDGEKQMSCIRELRKELSMIENSIN